MYHPSHTPHIVMFIKLYLAANGVALDDEEEKAWLAFAEWIWTRSQAFVLQPATALVFQQAVTLYTFGKPDLLLPDLSAAW